MFRLCAPTIIDPTGAGDALTAAVLFGLMNQMPIDDAVTLRGSCQIINSELPWGGGPRFIPGKII